MFAQVDNEGSQLLLFPTFLYHQKTSLALEEHEAIDVLSNSFQQRKPTTKAWEILVTRKDRSRNWIALKDVTDTCYPVQELAEYAFANKLDKEPVAVCLVG
jgi:hypothetical protein